MFGKPLVTHQTGPEGQVVRRLYIEQGLDIKRELYVALVVDRETRRIAVIASTEGGMDIEEVAAKTPEKIVNEFVDPLHGLAPYQARKLAFKLRVGDGSPDPKSTINQFVNVLSALARLFEKEDCSLCEINPLIVTGQGDIVALDAKINFDDNAMFRHPDLRELRDFTEEDPLEIEASKYSLNYIKLDGNVGCMVNGAGLAMATMDIIKHAGGMPANFLDVGGGANAEQVTHAFEILLSDKHVKAVLINIFGGILRVDTLATGVVEAAKRTRMQLPIVLRLEGTNVEQGREILKQSGLNFIVAETMKDAAEKVVAAAG
jgi:succinyl-CoA synthetase beta subunit